MGSQSSEKETPVKSRKGAVRLGPWGGTGGLPWDDGSHNGVKEVILVHGHCIDSIRVQYLDRSGRTVLSDRHGGDGDGHQQVSHVTMRSSEEFLTAMSGHYGPVLPGGPVVVRSLSFRTSEGRCYGPYGREEGTPFTLPMEGGKVVGFSGRSDGRHLDAVGCSLCPVRAPNVFDKMQQKIQRKLGSRTIGHRDREAGGAVPLGA